MAIQTFVLFVAIYEILVVEVYKIVTLTFRMDQD